jgi:aspartyl-tRNA(Asn)/glutamyl-tRNA(Gln) amidotransferase subunit A
VGDVARACAAISGLDARDATSADLPPPDFTEALAGDARGRRVGVPRRLLEPGVEAGVSAAFEQALRDLAACGVELIDVDLPHAPHAIATYYVVATAEASSNLARFDGVRYGRRVAGRDLPTMYGRTRDQGFGAEVKRRILLGTFVLSSGYSDAYYLRAQRVRTLIRRDYEQALSVCDAIATPTSPTPAFRLGERTDNPLQMYLADVFTVPANLAGLPGLSLPCGFSAGLPVGLQLVGRAFDEAALVRLGAAYQRVTQHHRARPSL